jgi:hypothetical protein
MPDTTPAVVTTRPSRFITILTIVNAVVLALIILGAIIHHHRMKRAHEQGFAGGGRDGGAQREDGFRGGFEKFHHFRHFGEDGGPGMMGRPGGFGGPGGDFGRQHGMGGMGMRHGGMGMAGNPDQMTDAIVQHLSQQLSLTDDQKAKIKPLIQADVAEFQKNAQALRAAMQKQFEDAKAQIKPLLNADQQKQLDALPVPGQKAADAGPAAK